MFSFLKPKPTEDEIYLAKIKEHIEKLPDSSPIFFPIGGQVSDEMKIIMGGACLEISSKSIFVEVEERSPIKLNVNYREIIKTHKRLLEKWRGYTGTTEGQRTGILKDLNRKENQ